VKQSLYVTKRNGKKEPINLEKIHRVLNWASKGLKNISISQIELKSRIQFYNGITTINIHETIIKSAADLISKENSDYQYLSARLVVFHLRKKAYGKFHPPKLYNHIKNMIKKKKYDKEILKKYSKEN